MAFILPEGYLKKHGSNLQPLKKFWSFSPDNRLEDSRNTTYSFFYNSDRFKNIYMYISICLQRPLTINSLKETKEILLHHLQVSNTTAATQASVPGNLMPTKLAKIWLVDVIPVFSKIHLLLKHNPAVRHDTCQTSLLLTSNRLSKMHAVKNV